jgi:hypothetical protein
MVPVMEEKAEERMIAASGAFSWHSALMKVIRKTNQELVVADSSICVSVMLLCADVIVAYRVYVTGMWGALVVVGFLTLCAFLFWRREVVVFDAGRQQAEWKRVRAYKLDEGNIPFSGITGIGMDTSSAKNNQLVYRLTMLTGDKPVPLSDVFRGDKERCDSVRAEILAFLHLEDGGGVLDARATHDNAIEALLRQGRKVDAIELVRASEKIGLAEAAGIVNGIEEGMKAAN